MKTILKSLTLFIGSIAVLSGCMLPPSNHDVIASAIAEKLACVALTRKGGQICSMVTSQPMFPSDDIQIYYVPENASELQLLISQTDLGSMYSDIQLFSNDKWLVYGTAEEGHLVYKTFQVDKLIQEGTFSEPEFIVGEYGLMEIIDINEQGDILYEIDFHMKRPSLKCIENSPPEQCYIEDKIRYSTEFE